MASPSKGKEKMTDAPSIPLRTSSMPVLTFSERRLKLQESRETLKRKISETSLDDDDPHRPLKLHIEQTQLEKDGLNLELDELSADLDAKKIGLGYYRSMRKKKETREFSVGERLWESECKLYAAKEQSGEAPALNLDSGVAYATALINIYKDPYNSSKRSRIAQKEMRGTAIEMYAALESKGSKGNPARLRCNITGRFYPADVVKAAHIVPAILNSATMDYLFGEGSGARMFTADNCLLMHTTVEKAFDIGQLVLLPANPHEHPIRRWKTVVTTEEAKKKHIDLPSFEMLGDLHGMEVSFRTEHRPAARFLYYHFVMSLLRLRQYRREGWEQAWSTLRTRKPWPTPGPYLRKSMLLKLAGAVRDVNEEDLDRLVADGTFDTPESLAEEQENVVALRFRNLHATPEEEEEEEEGSDDDPGEQEDTTESE